LRCASAGKDGGNETITDNNSTNRGGLAAPSVF
jgi:hypothetical protein